MLITMLPLSSSYSVQLRLEDLIFAPEAAGLALTELWEGLELFHSLEDLHLELQDSCEVSVALTVNPDSNFAAICHRWLADSCLSSLASCWQADKVLI